MKRFTLSNPIIEFPVRCPKDGGVRQALAKAFCAPNQAPTLSTVECHGSYECPTCQQCMICMIEAFKGGHMPEQFTPPLDPRLLPDWRA